MRTMLRAMINTILVCMFAACAVSDESTAIKTQTICQDGDTECGGAGPGGGGLSLPDYVVQAFPEITSTSQLSCSSSGSVTTCSWSQQIGDTMFWGTCDRDSGGTYCIYGNYPAGDDTDDGLTPTG